VRLLPCTEIGDDSFAFDTHGDGVVRRHDDGVIATMTATPLVNPNARLVGTVVSGVGGGIDIGAVIISTAPTLSHSALGRRGDGHGERAVRVPCLRSAWPVGGVPAVGNGTARADEHPPGDRVGVHALSSRGQSRRADCGHVFLSTLVSRASREGIGSHSDDWQPS
jgi:hypothetical protein